MRLGVLLRLLFFAAVGVHLWIFGLTSIATLTLTEAEWTLVAFGGVVYSADFVREAVGDVRATRSTEEVAREFAEILLLVGFVLLVAHLILFGIGILASTTPQPVHQANLNASRTSGTAFTLMALAMVLTLASIRKRRRRIMELSSAGSAIVGASR